MNTLLWAVYIATFIIWAIVDAMVNRKVRSLEKELDDVELMSAVLKSQAFDQQSKNDEIDKDLDRLRELISNDETNFYEFMKKQDEVNRNQEKITSKQLDYNRSFAKSLRRVANLARKDKR